MKKNKNKLMTQKQYLSHDGMKCPKCKSELIGAGSIEAEALYGWQDIKCQECDYEWQDLWTLTGYAKL